MVSKESTLLDKELLLTDAFYGKKVSEEMQGNLFHYTVTAYFTDTKTFCVTYMMRMILKVLAEIDNTPRAKAENEYKQVLIYIKFKNLPKMRPVWFLYW
jgi:hypothetical protein